MSGDDQQHGIGGGPAPSSAVSEDPLAGDSMPSPGRNDTDFDASGAEKLDAGSDSDWASDLTDDTDDRRRKRHARWERGKTPEGARRSARHRDDDEGDGPSRRRKGSATPTDGAAGTANTGRHGDGGAGEGADDEDGDVGYGSPDGVVLRRHVSNEQIEEEIAAIHGLWEMAAVLDFFSLFRKQLALTRQFSASELERVLVTSPGDGGLLADIHIVSL